ncbi:XRE family transcriptional regulator, partial [Proteus mirabilis]
NKKKYILWKGCQTKNFINNF